jgi:hypothetical protein
MTKNLKFYVYGGLSGAWKSFIFFSCWSSKTFPSSGFEFNEYGLETLFQTSFGAPTV